MPNLQPTIQSAELNGKSYNYIENMKTNDESDPQLSSVQGFTLAITPEISSLLLNTGGTMRQLLEPLNEDPGIYQLDVLSITAKNMTPLSGYFYHSKAGIRRVLIQDKVGIIVMLKNMKKHSIPFTLVNSIKYINKHQYEEQLAMFTTYYYEPKHESDTGLYLRGDMIEYGAKLLITDVQAFAKLLSGLDSYIEKTQPDSFVITINDYGNNTFSGLGKLYAMRNGFASSLVEMNYYSIDTELTLSEFIVASEQEIHRDLLARRTRKLARTSNPSPSKIKEITDYYNQTAERDIEDLHRDDFEFLQVGPINTILNSNLATLI